jgi:hypothetical protein
LFAFITKLLKDAANREPVAGGIGARGILNLLEQENPVVSCRWLLSRLGIGTACVLFLSSSKHEILRKLLKHRTDSSDLILYTRERRSGILGRGFSTDLSIRNAARE